MSSLRTQIYLTKEQRHRLDFLMHHEKKTMAQLIREALDAYLATVVPAAAEVLDRTFGALPDLEVPSRDEWDRG
jgi:predicted DNA-binding protein